MKSRWRRRYKVQSLEHHDFENNKVIVDEEVVGESYDEGMFDAESFDALKRTHYTAVMV